jgi:hypothetical protein
MELILKQILEFTAHPVILILASGFIFFLLAWLALPFALYGIRRRLDRIVQLLEQGAQVSAGRGDASAVSPDSTDSENVASALFVDLRRDLLRIARPLRERVFDQKNVVLYYERDGEDNVELVFLSLRDEWVLISFPLEELTVSVTGFSSDQFQSYIASFLPEKFGYFSVLSPDGRELQINLEPRETNQLELFVGIVKEQLVNLVEKESVK